MERSASSERSAAPVSSQKSHLSRFSFLKPLLIVLFQAETGNVPLTTLREQSPHREAAPSAVPATGVPDAECEDPILSKKPYFFDLSIFTLSDDDDNEIPPEVAEHAIKPLAAIVPRRSSP